MFARISQSPISLDEITANLTFLSSSKKENATDCLNHNQIGGYLIGRGLGGFDKANIHQAGWDKEKADSYPKLGMNAAMVGSTAASLWFGFNEYLENQEAYEIEAKKNYFIVVQNATGLKNYYEVLKAEKLLKYAFNIGLIGGSIIIASESILAAAYARAIDMSVDRIKESLHLGETPEHESYQEEKLKEYFFDKIRESNNE